MKKTRIIGSIGILLVILRWIGGEDAAPAIDDAKETTPIVANKDDHNDNQKDMPQPSEDVTVIVDPAQARTWGLPAVTFDISYTAHPQMDVTLAQAGQKNLNYIMFERYDEEDAFLESFNIGYYDDSPLVDDTTRINLLNDIVDQMSTQANELDIIELGMAPFWGQEVPLVDFTRTQTIDTITNETASYRTRMVLFPSPVSGENGVLLGFNAIEEHPSIDTFAKLGNQGYLQAIIDSFSWKQ